MRIWLLWAPSDGDDMPWLADAVDEYTIEEHGDFPPEYKKRREDFKCREMMIDISEKAVRALFEPPLVKATILDGEP
jgi:hypothetical protein